MYKIWAPFGKISRYDSCLFAFNIRILMLQCTETVGRNNRSNTTGENVKTKVFYFIMEVCNL